MTRADTWWQSARPRSRWLAVAATALPLWTALDVTTYRAFTAEVGASVWYPPVAIDVVVLLVVGLRYAPLLLTTNVVHKATSGEPVGYVQYAAVDVATTAALVGVCWLLLRRVGMDPRLLRLRDVLWFAGGLALVGTFVESVVSTVLLSSFGAVAPSALVSTLLHAWAGRATGVGMLAPLLLVLLRRLPSVWAVPAAGDVEEGATRRTVRPAEVAAQLLALALAIWISYGGPRGTGLDYSYVIAAPMSWIAVRWGFIAITAALPLVNVAAAGTVLATEGDVGSFALQFGLMTVTITSLLLAAVVTEQRRAAEALRHNALHDALTRLPNRFLLDDRLQQVLRRARRQPDATFAVLLVDLDHFKDVNDAAGHLAGDRLLQEMARRLRAALRPGDTVARFGGDEFVLVVEDVDGSAGAQTVAARLRTLLHAAYRLDDVDLHVTASVGIVLGPEGHTSPAELLRDADLALHQAKRDGRDRYVIYDESLHRGLSERVRLERDLRRAVEARRLQLHYQPIVDLGTGRVAGVEALLRWRHAQLGLIDPEVFVAAAERSGLMPELGTWVLWRACAQLGEWQRGGLGVRYVAVNVAPEQLRDPKFPESVRAALAAAGLPSSALQLELTESGLLQATDATAQALSALAADGVGIAIDDFGTGYAALTNLLHVPASTLKIDRSFVRASTKRGEGLAVTQAILAMGAALDIDVVAEGVESEAELALLRELGCPKAQGFLLGAPEAPREGALTGGGFTPAKVGPLPAG